MRYTQKLKFLFSIIVILLISILLIELLNTQHAHSEPEPFYCGTPNYAYPEQVDFGPSHDAGEQLFKENCKSCHKIHEESVGPALFGVTERRPKKWIYAYMKNPKRLLKKGDTMAVNLYNKYNKIDNITAFHTFSEADIDSMLIYIESLPLPNTKVIFMP